MVETKTLDYYEFLQISPNADADTIHRVYRFLAARFHPDNPDSGDDEKFRLLKAAYDVLSEPESRAKYDLDREMTVPEKPPLSVSVDFMDSLAGELNRRLAVLAVLYWKRRTNPYAPEVGLAEIEKRMGFPRDYLDFTTWYLSKKGYITRADNSDFTLTAQGVDFVETQRMNIPVLNKMLTNGTEISEAPPTPAPVQANPTDTAEAIRALENPGSNLIVLPDMTVIVDRRSGSRDRRVNGVDRRGTRDDRRSGT
ncbi:MAG TPA: J domain-containing protein [Terracidiphilus sp.]|jgi:curved DNA-binding protein|nr:J domain-containing protein [Terracidiphilus sp.]